MVRELRTEDAWDETEYFLKCSDCENEQERCFSPQQALELGRRDGWRSPGSRIVCPKCASVYPAE